MQDGRFPVTQAQLGVILESIQNPDTSQGLVNFILDLTTDFDTERLAKAIEDTANRHDVFFTRFGVEGGDFYQYADRSRPISVKICEMAEEDVPCYIQEQVRPLDLFREMLFSAQIIKTPQAIHVIYNSSHAIFDGASHMIFMNEVMKRYQGLDADTEDIPFQESVESELQEIGSEEYQKAKEYSLRTFAGCSATQIPQKHPEALGLMKRIFARVEGEEIERFTHKTGIKANRIFMTAFAMLLHSCTGEDRVVYDALYHGRDTERKKRSYGMYVRNVPVIADFSNPETTIRDLTRGFDENFAGNPHGVYPFVHFCNDLGTASKCSYSYVSGRSFVKCGDRSFPTRPYHGGKYADDTSLLVFGNTGYYDVCVEYNVARSDEAFAQQLLQSVVAMTYNIVRAGADVPLSSVRLISEQEEQRLLALGRGPKLPEEPLLLHQLIAKQVRQTPDNTAVVDCEGSITYAQLDALSDCFASWLQAHDITSGQTILLKLPRRKEFVIAALGAMKAGVTYVPIDINYPEERILYMQQNSDAGMVLTQDDVVEALQEKCMTRFVATAQASDIAYIIYTSGSTGNPKGVCISQRALTTFVRNCICQYDLTGQDRIMCQGTFSFDASVEDLFPVLVVGGELHILHEESTKDIDSIYSYIIQKDITGCNFTTQLGLMLLKMYPNLPLRYITVGGESLTALPQDMKCRMFNSYGPTEFTVDATFWEAPMGTDIQEIPIGRPVGNAQFYVLDRQHRLLPQGCSGELFLAGDQIAQGYCNLPEETEKRFVHNPYSPEYPVMYATGDIVRWGQDGNLFFVGRRDGQVKLRGYRIELDEVDSTLMQYEHLMGVQSAVVKLNNTEMLCTWYMSAQPVPEQELKSFISARVPAFMIPDVFVHVTEFPCMPNGKVDVKALPIPQVHVSHTNIVEPESAREIILYRLAKLILGFDDFGVTDRLRDLGMTSIKSMQFCSDARKEHVLVKVSDVMANKSIRELSRGASTLVSWFRPYEPGKPILVMISGIVSSHYNIPRMEYLSQGMNIMFIEPLEEHYKIIFNECGTYQSVVSLYYALVDAFLPEGEKIAAIMGISLAGNFAVTMAKMYFQNTGIMTRVIIGDSRPDYPLEEDMTEQKYREKYSGITQHIADLCAFRRKDYPDEESFMEFVRHGAELTIFRYTIADKVCNGHVSECLDCDALLINTTVEKPRDLYPQLWSKRVRSLQVLDLDRTHLMMCGDLDGKDRQLVCNTILDFVLTQKC